MTSPTVPLTESAPVIRSGGAEGAAMANHAHQPTAMAASVEALADEHRLRRHTSGCEAIGFLEALLLLGHIPEHHADKAKRIVADWNEANDTVREAKERLLALWTMEARR